MTQGNQFGNAGGRWMPSAKLRAMYRAGRTYDEIAEANLRAEGWKPSRSGVLRKLQALNLPPRQGGRHSDLIPWQVSIEHNSSLFRHMLSAESRKREGLKLSATDRKLISRLNDLLFGRGTPMVIAYHPETGFSLVLAEEGDDIIRRPTSASLLRKELRADLRRQAEEQYDPETAQRIMEAIGGATSPDAADDSRDHRERA